MGNVLISNVVRFVLLLVFQLLVFNNVTIFGYVTPYPYVLFVILFPAKVNRKTLLVCAFLIGYLIDLSSDSGGVHAMASLLLAYNRKRLFNLFFGATYENQTLDLKKPFSMNTLKYVTFFVLFHHFIIQLFSIFSFAHFGDVILRTILSSIVTLFIVVSLFMYFRHKSIRWEKYYYLYWLLCPQ